MAAAGELTNERAAQAGVTSPVAGFYPSLQLNLGECYPKLGEMGRAREYLEFGLATVDVLDQDGIRLRGS